MKTDTPADDYFFRVPHSHLAWSILEVRTRQTSEGWQFSIGYQFQLEGLGTPFTGRFPSRESAGRNGLLALRDALRHRAGYTDRVSTDREQAAKYADEIQERLFPSQPEFSF